MELQTLIYLFVGISFAIYIGIALWAKAGSSVINDEYIVYTEKQNWLRYLVEITKR